MKFFVICSLVAVVAMLQMISAQNHNNHWGTQNLGDKLLIQRIVKEKSKFLQIVKKEEEFKNLSSNITFIRATDQYVDDNGGYATLIKGGVGNRNVTVQIKSKRNHGFSFIIEIYGK